MPNPIITLTTDLGNSSYFVGSIKGVILNINPQAVIIDITHQIPPFDILQASLTLAAASKYFPAPTIHVVVVDPGVGSDRKPILAVGENHYYIAPDNGVLSRIFSQDSVSEVRVVEEEHYMLPRTCETFHGRDVFAPIAAWLSKYHNAQLFGEVVENYKIFDLPKPKFISEKVMECHVLFADRFGNLITSLERDAYEKVIEKLGAKRLKIKVGGKEIDGLKTHYFDAPARGDLLALFGSMDFLEISVREASAERALSVKAGSIIQIEFGE
jgi:S-adenosyl-L-methionine hydrolase (adenosine-forming)